jgi:GH15 family glucan-1,4-alpha-glucosidase
LHFWLVEALTRAGRDVPGAAARSAVSFEQMLGYANHLGPLRGGDQPERRDARANFPQAFTHLALISAAFNLDRALDGR